MYALSSPCTYVHIQNSTCLNNETNGIEVVQNQFLSVHALYVSIVKFQIKCK